MSMTSDNLHGIAGQKLLVLEPFFATPHVETGLEITRILSVNNEVTYVGPDALRCVTAETHRLPGKVMVNLSRKRRVSDYVHPTVHKMTRREILALTARPDAAEVSSIIDFHSASFDSATLDGFDLGMGIKSSLLSLTRDTSVSPTDHISYSMSLARDAVMLYRLTVDLLRTRQYDGVVLFNGRLAPVRAIRRACEATGTRYFVHERGSSNDKYAVYDCATPHQPAKYRGWVDTWWQSAHEPMRNAREFLDRRRNGIVTSWYSYTGEQVKGTIPPGSGRKRVTFFTSSEDELAAIGDELPSDSAFCDQITAITSLGAACRERGWEFVIRFHPNTSKHATSLMQIAEESAEVICAPSGKVDSYALAESSDLVFTQNSTMGIEAASAGKSVFYTGRNIFEACRSVRRVKTDADLSEALDTCAQPDPLDAFKYANFFGTHGISYRYYKPRGVLSGTYLGADLNAPLSTLRDLKLYLTRGGR